MGLTGGGQHVVVRNTFIDFSEDVFSSDGEHLSVPARNRALSDITDSKMPVKIQLSNCPGLSEVTRHRLASASIDGDVLQGNVDILAGHVHGNCRLGPVERLQAKLPMVAEQFRGVGVDSCLHPQQRNAHVAHGVSSHWSDRESHTTFDATVPWMSSGSSHLPPPRYPPGILSGDDTRTTIAGQPGKAAQSLLELANYLCENKLPPRPQSTSCMNTTNRSMRAHDELTTVMLRNIPKSYTRSMMLELLECNNLGGQFDFFYLPIDFRNRVNLGYAFVNALSNQHALAIAEKFQGFAAWENSNGDICEVSWAHPNQGLQDHIERYRNSPVMHPSVPDEYKPAIFANGKREVFPAPTKPIKSPKVRVTSGRLQ